MTAPKLTDAQRAALTDLAIAYGYAHRRDNLSESTKCYDALIAYASERSEG